MFLGVRAVLACCLAVAVAAVATGCGNEPAKPPTVTAPSDAFGWVDQDIPTQGVKFQRPQAWRYTPGEPPLLGTISSGLVTISVWRYPREETLPESLEELTVAKDALVAAAQARDATFEVIKAKGTRAAHRPAVVIIADETVDGQPRRVRSTHIYTNDAEFVIDAFAPADQYAKVEEPIIVEMVRTFEFSNPTQ
jgi:hypothetical protein